MNTALDAGLPHDTTPCAVCGHAFPYPLEHHAFAMPCSVCGSLPWCRLTRRDGFLILELVPDRTPDAEQIDWFAETHVRWSERQNVVCDLAALDVLDSALVAGLVLLHRRVKATQHRLVLCGVGPLVREQFAVLKLDRFFELVDDQPDPAKPFELAVSR